MKLTKKFFAMLLCLALVLSLATTAFAANANEHTITVSNATEGYEYVAYQIFKGDLVEGQLTNIEWGGNISDGAALLTELKTLDAFAECENVVDVATVLGEIKDKDHATTVAFADAVSKYLTTGNAGVSTYADSKYTINVFGDGYYLVKNTKVPAATETTAAGSYTRYILQVVGDISVSHKGTVPSVDKKIVEGTGKVDANTAEIGETVNYVFTGTMPTNIADYDTYYYVFTDIMSDGLTYTNNLKVTVNEADVTDYFYANATVNADGTTTLKVGIQDILALEDLTTPNVGDITAATTVVVTYTALVNEKAEIGVNGETNQVKLTFSNDPNDDGDGTTTPPDENPGEPNPTLPTGETPNSYVKTYSTEIKLTKVDGLDNSKTLTGAKFSISGISSNVKVINKEMYVEANDGTYYRLKDGTYTTTVPVFEDNAETTDVNEKTSDAYDLETNGTAKKYKKVEVVTAETVATPFTAEGWVNESGVITFTGLGEGTYTIKEIVAPDGYNLLTKDITIVIDSNVDELNISTGEETITWSATQDGDTVTLQNGKVEIIVKNTSGSTLPETGGIGTTLFYIFGGMMAVMATVLLVTKKRMNVA